MKKLYKLLLNKILLTLNPVPEIQIEYVDKVVYLLRRDFTPKQQNEIILSISKKLNEARQIDMDNMEKHFREVQDCSIQLSQFSINSLG